MSAPPTIREDEEWVDLRTSHNVETPEELHKRLWDEGPQINVHQQSDQTILALAILGIHSNEYASVWFEFFKKFIFDSHSFFQQAQSFT